MLVLDKAIIKKYWPAEDKDENDQIIRQVVLQVEAELDDSKQVSELFRNMVRGLVRISVMDNLTGEEYEIPAVTIRPFNIKQKKVKLGKGEENDFVKTEYAALNLVCRAKDDDSAGMMADLYRYFNIDIRLTFNEFKAPGLNKAADE
jgi:hypothetical protein